MSKTPSEKKAELTPERRKKIDAERERLMWEFDELRNSFRRIEWHKTGEVKSEQ